MNSEETAAFTTSKRFRSAPMRGSKQIQHDVRHGSSGGSVVHGGSLPLYPPFRQAAGPSYR